MADSHARPFADFLREGAPRAHDELSEALHELIAAVEDTHKAGTVTLTLKVEPDKDLAGTFRISDTVKKSIPAHDRPKRIFFRDKHGNLTRNDPNQLEFEGLRDVSVIAEAKPLKEVN